MAWITSEHANSAWLNQFDTANGAVSCILNTNGFGHCHSKACFESLVISIPNRCSKVIAYHDLRSTSLSVSTECLLFDFTSVLEDDTLHDFFPSEVSQLIVSFSNFSHSRFIDSSIVHHILLIIEARNVVSISIEFICINIRMI
jgi:hypothetical protein